MPMPNKQQNKFKATRKNDIKTFNDYLCET